MFKFKTEHKVYVAVMAAAFAVLDMLGVSHGDKLALSALFGATAPLYFPRITARLLSQN